MTSPRMPDQAARQYALNHIYVYPEHRDHDAVDYFPANWPYTLISQGSSGSDRIFLRAIAFTLAAFPKDTFDRMRELGLVAPTVQALLRRNLRQVTVPEDYFTGAAHPAVFYGRDLRPARMMAAAAAMTPEDIPPRVDNLCRHRGFWTGSRAGRADRTSLRHALCHRSDLA